VSTEPHTKGRPGAVIAPRDGPRLAAAPRRRGRPGYDLAGLLDVAVEVFNERGYDGTRMEDLAERLGISKSAIYHHVAGKEELLELALDDALDGLFAVVDDVATGHGAPVERLEELVRGSIGVLSARLPYVTLLLRVHGNSQVERAALARRRQFDDHVAALVADAVDDGDLRVDLDPAITARLLFGLVNSIVEWYRPRTDTDHTVIADAVVRIAFEGIRTRPAE
jgi:AcrR family transcriptional regulator